MFIPIHYCTQFECYLYNVTSKKTKEENVIMHSMWMQRAIYRVLQVKKKEDKCYYALNLDATYYLYTYTIKNHKQKLSKEKEL